MRRKTLQRFLFSEVDKEEILTNILDFDTSKTCQDTDVPPKNPKGKCRKICRFFTFNF